MRTRRKAFTLVEMLVVIGISSAIFGVVTLTLTAMFRTTGRLGDAVSVASQQQRFATQLRCDAHLASSAVLSTTEESSGMTTILRLEMAEGRWVEYRLRNEAIERCLHEGEEVLAVDSYRVVPAPDTGWTIDNDRPQALLSIYLQSAIRDTINVDSILEPRLIQTVVGITGHEGPLNKREPREE